MLRLSACKHFLLVIILCAEKKKKTAEIMEAKGRGKEGGMRGRREGGWREEGSRRERAEENTEEGTKEGHEGGRRDRREREDVGKMEEGGKKGRV